MCGEYLDVLFIKQADEVRFGELKTTLANGHLNPASAECGYLKTLHGALHLLNGYTSIVNNRRQHNNNNASRNDVAFVEQKDFFD